MLSEIVNIAYLTAFQKLQLRKVGLTDGFIHDTFPSLCDIKIYNKPYFKLKLELWPKSNDNSERRHTDKAWTYLYGILWGEGHEAGGDSERFFLILRLWVFILICIDKFF